MRWALIALLCQACATTVSGTVFLDRNRDRIRQADEPGVADVVVAVDRGVPVRTRADGTFTISSPSGDGIVWARVPDGFRPASVWARASEAERVGLPLAPLTTDELAAPLSFVVAADTHTTAVDHPAENGKWDGGDLDDALSQAVSLGTAPRFFTIVGDVTQANGSDEFARVEESLAKLGAPWIPVPGNHDWYDAGVTWRQRWGPDNYSFDTGNLHVVVWDTNLAEEDQIAFFRNDLAILDPTQVVVALGHASPTDAVADQLAELGVDYMFTGHWHANRRAERKGLVEWGTQTLVMGTIDQSPSGYRVVTFVDGVPTVEHRARVTAPHLAVSSPHVSSCATAATQLLVSAALDAAVPRVRATIDCGAELELPPIASAGGSWSFGLPLPALLPGTHTIDVIAEAPSGRRITKRLDFAMCTPPEVAPSAGEWTQVGGSAKHTGATDHAIAPPLTQRWAVSVGGTVVLGTPVVKDGIVVVGVWDLGSGDRGGLVALDLATGAEKWRAVTPYSVRAAPAIGGDTVVAALENGELRAFSLTDGTPRWTYDVADGVDSLAASLWAPPAIEGDTVYIAVQGRIAAVALADGTVTWKNELAPSYAWLGSLAAITVADGAAVSNVSRNDGMAAWSTATGTPRWKLAGGKTTAIHATPIIDGGDLIFINSAGVVTRSSLASTQEKWTRALVEGGHEWSYAVTAAPALAHGRLFVPTQYQELVALDASSGAPLWHHATRPGPLNFAHYRASEPGFTASPVVTGDLVWVPHPDGTLVALAAVDGHELWKTNLGAPIVSSPAPAGDTLVVATFDGVVRALVPSREVTPGPSTCIDPFTDKPVDELDAAGGCCESGSSSTTLLLTGLLALLLRRRS